MSAPIIHTTQSASDAEVWLADLELDSGRPLSRVTRDKASGGGVKVTVELGDLPTTDRGRVTFSEAGRGGRDALRVVGAVPDQLATKTTTAELDPPRSTKGVPVACRTGVVGPRRARPDRR